MPTPAPFDWTTVRSEPLAVAARLMFERVSGTPAVLRCSPDPCAQAASRGTRSALGGRRQFAHVDNYER